MNQKLHFRMYKPIYQFMNLCRNSSRSSLLLSSSTLEPKYSERIKLPLRIKRGPTDILKALADTVHTDPTGPAYKFYDDPYLYPLSNFEKKTYALSKESGRKAARFIRENHAAYFTHQPDDPIIKEFLPKIQFDENSEVTENDLLHSIKIFQISDSINLYELCQLKDIELSAETRQSLLELLCHSNCEEAIDSEWVEEMRTLYMLKSSRPIKTWKDNGLCEQLFEGLKKNGVAPYCAIIKGMCNFYQSEKAWQLYQECLDQNLILDTETFNALIRIAPIFREENEFRWTLMQEILQKMADLGVTPNLGTMNAILESLSVIRSWSKVKTLSLQVLTEFKQFNIQPSLASYYFLLKIFYTMRNASSPLLPSILNEIETKSFTLRDPKDTMFFFTAMEICKRDLLSMETAERLNKMLFNGENYDLLGENIKEVLYFRNYFILSVNSLPLVDFMQIYSRFVPHLYSPDREVMEEIVKMIGIHDELSLLPRIWSDCILLEMARNEKLMEMSLMVINKNKVEEVDDELKEQLVNVASDIWNRIQNQNERLRIKIEWTGQMLGDCISSLVRCGAVEMASEIMSEVEQNPSIMVGELPLETLKFLFDGVMAHQNFKVAFSVIKYAKDNEYPEAFEMAKQLWQESSLPKDVKSKLVSSFGTEIV